MKVTYIKCLLTLVMTSLLALTACSYFSPSHQLTVTNIHDKIIFGKTTTSELKDIFGKESKYIDSKEAEKIYHYWSDLEGGVNYSLEDKTDYWETLNVDPKTKGTVGDGDIEGCYEYRGNQLGVKSVYFFVIDNKIYFVKFNGDITDKKVAKKDKYLRQIID